MSKESTDPSGTDAAEVKRKTSHHGPPRHESLFMNVREAASYLHVNEKKIYSLASEGKIPCTKVTGKWLFPRDLVDQWLTRSSHGGVLMDRLLIAGAEDELVSQLVARINFTFEGRAMLSVSNTGTRIGLHLLSSRRCDACLINWATMEESAVRHPALLRHFPEHSDWVIVRACRREQGVMLRPGLGAEPDLNALLKRPRRLLARNDGSGTMRHFNDFVAALTSPIAALDTVGIASTSSEAAARLRAGEADIAPATRAHATAAGLEFVATSWEALDLVLSRGLYFRTLLQHLLEALRSDEARLCGQRLGGYDLHDCGKLVWAPEQ